MKRLLKFLTIFTLIVSCGGEEQFATGTTPDKSKAQSYEYVEEDDSCSIPGSSTPPVDILFVVDNSSSINYLRDQIEAQISDLVFSISQRFNNYHALIVPLIPEPGEQNLTSFPLLTDSTDTIDPSYLPYITSASAFELTNNPVVTAEEKGFERIFNVIDANTSDDTTKRVFRKNAYTVVVLITTGSDSNVTQFGSGGTIINQPNLNNYKERLRQYHIAHPNSTLQSLQFRFVSLVPHKDSCRIDPSRRSFGYISASESTYSYNRNNPAPGFPPVNDQAGRDKPDSYNLCSKDLRSSFEDIRGTIESMRVGHVYNYWPIQLANESSEIDFDPTTIKVFKGNFNQNESSSGNIVLTQPQEVQEDETNGYTYAGFLQNQNMRTSPPPSALLPPETETGFFVQLHGSAQVKFPDCMEIRRQAPKQWFAFFATTKEPRPETIVVTIDGENIPESSTNGWTYSGEFVQTKNLQVVSPTDNSPGSPGKFKSGYLIEFHGSAIYNNEQNVVVSYKAKPI